MCEKMKISKPYFQISINFEKPQNPSCMIWKSILKNLKNLNLEVAGGDLKDLSPSVDKIADQNVQTRKSQISN